MGEDLSKIEDFPGDEPARRDRMLHDILFWRMDSPVEHPYPANLIVVSDKVRSDKSTENVQPESPKWPDLLLDQVYCVHGEREERSLKKKRPEGSEDHG